MKKFIIFLIILCSSMVIFASMRGRTIGGYPFAFEKSQMQKLSRLTSDKVAFTKYLNELTATRQGGILKDGMDVYIENQTLGLVEIRPAGETNTVWTVREAVKRN